MMKRTSLSLLALTLVGLFATGCGSGSTDSGSTATTTTTTGATAAGSKTDDSKPVEVAFVTNNSSDYWTIARKGTEKAEAELKGVKVDFKLPAGNGSAAEQKQIIDDLLAKGVQGIAISPVDPDNEKGLINDTAKKTLVITQDSDAPESDRACYIGTDNVEAGREAGAEIKKAVPNGGKVTCFVGNMDARNAKDRFQGIQEALKGSNITLTPVITDGADHLKAKSNAADIITKAPDTAAMVGLWSYNGPAILGAVKDANKLGKIKIICFDEEDDTLAGVKAGQIEATVVQHPFEFGYEAIKRMAAFARGHKDAFPDNKLMYIKTDVITKANVDEFKANLDKLRGRS